VTIHLYTCCYLSIFLRLRKESILGKPAAIQGRSVVIPDQVCLLLCKGLSLFSEAYICYLFLRLVPLLSEVHICYLLSAIPVLI